MLKNKNIEKLKDVSIQDMFTYVDVNTTDISQDIKNEWALDEEICMLTKADADILIDKGEIDFTDIYYTSDFDEIEYKYYIHELVKDAKHYLVFLPNSTWNGASGCGIVNSLEDAFYRDYDCHQYVKAVSKGNKAVLLKEYHHDVPMGHHVVIVALTDREYNKLENADFKTLEDFALNYLKSLETNKKELYKTIANI